MKYTRFTIGYILTLAAITFIYDSIMDWLNLESEAVVFFSTAIIVFFVCLIIIEIINKLKKV